MLFTEEWLRQFVNPAMTTEEIADALTMHGLEIEGVETVAPPFTGVVVAKVLTCRDHENFGAADVLCHGDGIGADGGRF